MSQATWDGIAMTQPGRGRSSTTGALTATTPRFLATTPAAGKHLTLTYLDVQQLGATALGVTLYAATAANATALVTALQYRVSTADGDGIVLPYDGLPLASGAALYAATDAVGDVGINVIWVEEIDT